MIRDIEGHQVQIVAENNFHKFVYGMTGTGKTYWMTREVEEGYRLRKKTLILDFSGSYTIRELCEKKFLYQDEITRYTLNEDIWHWIFHSQNIEVVTKDLTDSLCEALKIASYYQKKLLMNAVEHVMEKRVSIQIADIVMTLEEMAEEERMKEKSEKTVGNLENLQRLLTRLFPYSEIEGFCVGTQMETQMGTEKMITIIDLSSYPESQRRFMTELIISLLWREIYRQENCNRYDVLLLDEMQFLSLKEGSTLSNMLREGRKKHIELLLSTQYIGHYGKAELRALQQVDSMIIFRPAPEDYQCSARMIDPQNSNAWVGILSQLRKSIAVLRGSYHLNGNSGIARTPILVQIE